VAEQGGGGWQRPAGCKGSGGQIGDEAAGAAPGRWRCLPLHIAPSLTVTKNKWAGEGRGTCRVS
jgi:hypothetical protein